MKRSAWATIAVVIAFAVPFFLNIGALTMKRTEAEVEAVLIEKTVVIGGNSSCYDSILLNSSDGGFEGSISVTTNGTVLFAMEDEQFFNAWREGRWEPYWDVIPHYGGSTMSLSVPESGRREYFIFVNEEPSEKSVDYRLVKVYPEVVNLENFLWSLSFSTPFLFPLILYFALQAINIPRYSKFIIYPVLGILVITMPYWMQTLFSNF